MSKSYTIFIFIILMASLMLSNCNKENPFLAINTQVSINDDFNDNNLYNPLWELITNNVDSIITAEENGYLHFYGKGTEAYPYEGIFSFDIDINIPASVNQDYFDVSIDLKCGTITSNANFQFQIQSGSYGNSNFRGYGLLMTGFKYLTLGNTGTNQWYDTLNSVPLFGDETTDFHILKIKYNIINKIGKTYIDNIFVSSNHITLSDFRIAIGVAVGTTNYFEYIVDNLKTVNLPVSY